MIPYVTVKKCDYCKIEKIVAEKKCRPFKTGHFARYPVIISEQCMWA
jgi:hypothetical protein